MNKQTGKEKKEIAQTPEDLEAVDELLRLDRDALESPQPRIRSSLRAGGGPIDCTGGGGG